MYHLEKYPLTSRVEFAHTFHLYDREKAGSAAFTISDSDLYVILRCLFVDANRLGLTELSGTGLASFSVVLAHNCGDFDTVRIYE